MTRKLIQVVDKGGWACYLHRDNSERDRCSDRMKGIRRRISRKVRTYLKNNLNRILKEENII